MGGRGRAVARWVGAVAAVGCSQADPGPVQRPTAAALPEGVVALVGGQQVDRATVERIARARSVSPQAARDAAVRDALLAAAARADLAGFGIVASAERSILARALLEQFDQQARARPVTKAEVAEMTARRWAEFDRPVSARTAHAVARVNKPEDDAPARALAERIAHELAAVTDPEEFVKRAKEVPAGSVKVVAERLPPVTADGRVVQLNAPPGAPTRTFDPAYARAANALRSVGDKSPVTKTEFGYHVILLEERMEAKRVPLEQRRELLADEIMDNRAHRMQEQLLQQARLSHPVEVQRSAADLTARVRVRR
jgi:hypothetical protein